MRSPVGELVAAGRRGMRRIRNESPVPYVGRGGRFAGASSGVPGDMAAEIDAYGQNGTLFSIVERLATSAAGINWHMHRITGKETDMCPHCDEDDEMRYGVVPIDTHPALTVWNKPNDFFTPSLLVESFQQHLELVGEGWLTVAYAGNRPIELWPVRPDRMAPVRDPRKFIIGYTYRSPDGELVPLKLNEVLPMRRPAPWDPYRGAGAVQTILNNIYGAKYAAEWNTRFFQNNATPAGVIELPTNLTEDQWEEFQLRWAESHRGVSNAHSVAILEYGAKYVDVKLSQKDMDFVQLRQVSREEIREAFGIHGHMIGLSESVNRANADAGEASFARWLIKPRAERIKDMLNGPFLKLFGPMGDPRVYEFACAGVIPNDRTADDAERNSKATAFQAYIAAGADPAWAAEVCGLPAPKMAPKPDPMPALAPAGAPASGGGNG